LLTHGFFADFSLMKYCILLSLRIISQDSALRLQGRPTLQLGQDGFSHPNHFHQVTFWILRQEKFCTKVRATPARKPCSIINHLPEVLIAWVELPWLHKKAVAVHIKAHAARPKNFRQQRRFRQQAGQY
jgi:hypothetical protein